MNYVNAYGQPISIGSRESHVAKKTSKAKVDTEKHHMGWSVTGFSPEQLDKAKEEHEAAMRMPDAIKRGLQPWDEAVYMNGHRPQKARSKPYSIPESAAQCADMLKAAGWKRVQVAELIR
jgi:hypothetical protein